MSMIVNYTRISKKDKEVCMPYGFCLMTFGMRQLEMEFSYILIISPTCIVNLGHLS